MWKMYFYLLLTSKGLSQTNQGRGALHQKKIYSISRTCDDLSFSPKMKSCLRVRNIAKICYNILVFHNKKKKSEILTQGGG